jgi:hypothetical protein
MHAIGLRRAMVTLARLIIAASGLASAPAYAQMLSCPQITTTTVSTSGTDASRGQALRAAIEGSSGCEIIQIGNATYQIDGAYHKSGFGNDGVWITASNLEIRGQGTGSTVKFGRATYIGFVIDSGVHHLTMKNFAIRGSLVPGDDARRRYQHDTDDIPCDEVRDQVPCFTGITGAVPNVHGIGVYGGTTNVSHVLITQLDVQDVAVGINVGAEAGGLCAPASFDRVTISGNFLKNMYGRDSGSGYGIVTACASHLLVIDNTLMNTGRHAIYHGKTVLSGSPADDVRIVHNSSIDHGHVNGTLADPNRVAIVAARSRNVSIVDNTIIGSHEPGISVESETLTVGGSPVAFRAFNVSVIGNHFLDRAGAPANIWINASDGSTPSNENVVVWGNTQNGTPINCNSVGRVSVAMGHCDNPAYWAAGVGTQWIGFVGAASPDTAGAGGLQNGSALYVMQNNALHRVQPAWGVHPGTVYANSWPYVHSSTDWSYGTGVQGMSVTAGSIYVMQYHVLHRVTPGTTTGAWPYVYSTTSWNPGYAGLTTLGGVVYVVQNGVLHRVAPQTSNYPWPYTYQVIAGAGAIASADVLYLRRGSAISRYDGSLSALGDLN